MEAEVRTKIESILTRGKDLTIATLREDGYPQATTVSYVNDGLNIYFVCETSAQKARNIDKDNRVLKRLPISPDHRACCCRE